MVVYTETTEGIIVKVRPFFYEEKSNLFKREFCFVYFVSITNAGSQPVRLMRRHWYIHDTNGIDHEVEGEGVIGVQPLIQSTETHNYNSFCMLTSFDGSMEGKYLMEREDGSTFQASIPKFYLNARLN